MVVKKLVWDQRNIEHISRHNVSKDEVEETCRNKNLFTKGRSGLYNMIGQTDEGRYLIIILAPRPAGSFYPVTVRDADRKEIRRFKK